MAAQGMSRGKVDFTRDGIEQLQKDVIAGPKGEDISVYHRANTPLNPRGDIKTI